VVYQGVAVRDAQNGIGPKAQYQPGTAARRMLELAILLAGLTVTVSGDLQAASEAVKGRLVLGAATLFLGLVACMLEVVLHFGAREEPEARLPELSDLASSRGLDPERMLLAEFEYARITASEAMSDRHTVVNFYLLLAGAILSVVLGLLGAGTAGGMALASLPIDVQPYAGTLLLWTFDAVGLVYLLQIIRLRQAWRGSAATMNRIKEFYIEHVAMFSPQLYSEAFRWRQATMPQAEKKWTIHFFSAALIALLNSLIYVVGGLLLAGGIGLQHVWPWVALGLAALGLVMFGFSMLMYVVFLRENA